MKKFSIVIVFFLVLLSGPVYSLGNELVCKIGGSYAHELGDAGLDLSVVYLLNFDPYFVAGIEGSFFWIPWEKKLGTREEGSNPVDVDVVASANTFAIPVMFNAQVRLPFLVKKIYVEPYMTIGIGYTPVILTYDQPAFEDAETTVSYAEEDITRFFHGFSWQVLAGASFKPSKDSSIRFVGDIGYRGINAKKGAEKLDISGLLFRVGVLFKL